MSIDGGFLSITPGTLRVGSQTYNVSEPFYIKPGTLCFLYGGSQEAVSTFIVWLAGLAATLQYFRNPNKNTHDISEIYSGRLSLSGFDPYGYRWSQVDAQARARHVGLVFAEPHQYILGRTVADEIRYTFAAVGQERPEWSLFDKYGLTDKLQRLTTHLSGGEAHRLNIATALELKCPFLLLDLSASNIDQQFIEELSGYLRDRTKTAVTFIYGLTPRSIQSGRPHFLRIEDDGTVRLVLTEPHDLAPSTPAGETLRAHFTQRDDDSLLLEINDIHRPGITEPFSAGVARGGVYRLMGPNGSGKTTLGHVITDRLEPHEWVGSIVWYGACPRGSRAIMTPQYPSVAHLRVMSPAIAYGRAKLTPSVAPLSGQRALSSRKLAAASWALSGTQELIFLDEPTAGMSWADKVAFIGLLNAHADKSVLMSTHDPDLEGVGQMLLMTGRP
jgi:energy-coupling factor transporter ATP-binding protein EcfA2